MLAHDDSSSYPVAISPRARSLRHRLLALHQRAVAPPALVVFAVLSTACGSLGTKTGPTTPDSVEPTAATTLVIRNYTFVPPNLTVPPEATVTVRNEDQVIHTVTADSWSFITGNSRSSFNTGNVQ
jgi:plastocyanin